MLRHRHVITYGTTQYDWLSDLSDLDLQIINGKPVLLAATQYNGGGISSYSFGRSRPHLTQVDSSAYPGGTFYQGEPEFSRLDIAGRNFAYLSGLGNAHNLGLPVAANGTFGSFEDVFPIGNFHQSVTALAAVETATGNYVYSANPDALRLNAYRIDGIGEITDIDQSVIDLQNPHDFATIDQIIETQSAGHRFLVSISGLGDFLAVHRLDDNGGLQQVALHIGAFGIGYAIPNHVVAVQLGDLSLLIMSGAASSSLTVFELHPNGDLSAIDHILDEGTTRFGNVTALATATIGERVFIFVGGTDDGISVLTLQPDGHLLHLSTIADTAEMTLADVTDITTYVENGRITVFVASATETGITRFEFDPGRPGVFQFSKGEKFTGTTTNDLLIAAPGTAVLNGSDGDDILIAGTGQVQLTGGNGRDIFVLSQNGARNRIRDFEPGEDMLDLSQLGNIHSPDQLSIRERDGRIVLKFNETVYVIHFDKRKEFTKADFTDAMFAIRHYTPPPIPTETTEPRPVSDTGEHIFGTRAADVLSGGNGPDHIFSREGNDTVTGKAGNDAIDGMDGDDRLEGGAGADSIRGENGRDTILGGADADYLHGGALGDRISGGFGPDLLDGANGNDTLSGDIGHDRLAGGLGADILRGGLGDDTLLGGLGHDLITDMAGKNRILGMPGNDRIFGGGGQDVIDGGLGHDQLSGKGGSDRIIGGAGNDRITGGHGADWLRGGPGADVFVFTRNDSGPKGGDRIADFKPGTDLLDLSAMHLHYIGKLGFSGADQLRWEIQGKTTRISADFDGDGASDLQVILDGRLSLSPDDFIF